MATPYDGNPAGITDAQVVEIITPQGTDPRNVASMNTAITRLADFMKWAYDNKATRGAGYPNPSPIWFSLSGGTLARGIHFTDLGVAGPNLERAQVDTFFGSVGGTLCTTYIAADGSYEVAVNCMWVPAAKWQRGAAGTASVIRVTRDGPVVFQKSAGLAEDQWTDVLGVGGWNTEIALDLINFATVQGDVLGMTSAGIAVFGRPRETAQIPVGGAWNTGSLRSLRDSGGTTHIFGHITNAAFNGNAQALFTLPAGQQPNFEDLVFYAHAAVGGSPRAPVEITVSHTTGVASIADILATFPTFVVFGGLPANTTIYFNTSFPS